MVAIAAATSSQLLFSSSRSISSLSPFQLCVFDSKTLLSSPANAGSIVKKRHVSGGVRCMAVDTASEAETKKKGGFEIQTLTNWLLKQELAGVIDAELTIVISSISIACKQIASLVQRAGISNLTGVQGAVNVQGEDQKKLDVVSNEVFSNCLRSSGRTGIIASEEEDVPVAVEEVTLETILWFLIHLMDLPTLMLLSPLDPSLGYTALMMNAWQISVMIPILIKPNKGKEVFAFTLDPMYGEFVLTQENIQIPKAGKIYAFNEGNYQLWDDKLKKYMDDLKDPGPSGKPYSARYIGSLVGDFHRTLLYGGIYGYPRDKKSKNGKLRLLYECAPMSFIVEQAGGKGSDGHQRILDIQPVEIHQRVPLYIGSQEEVEKVEKYLA
ncbi:hypothetical protein SLE2022_104630 [Rubroshorea leprosula]